MEDENKMYEAQLINPQTEQEFLHWFRSLVFADDLNDVDKLARFTSDFIIEGHGAIIKFKNGHTFEIAIANHYSKND